MTEFTITPKRAFEFDDEKKAAPEFRNVFEQIKLETGYDLDKYKDVLEAVASGRIHIHVVPTEAPEIDVSEIDPRRAAALDVDAEEFRFAQKALAADFGAEVSYGLGGPDCGPIIVLEGPVVTGPAGGGTCPGMGGPELLEAIQLELAQIEAGGGWG